MKSAIYPGSFNPIHDGHIDVIVNALQVFDRVIVARGINPDKKSLSSLDDIKKKLKQFDRVMVTSFDCFLSDYVNAIKPDAVIKGLRDTNDFLYEQKQQYWNEDLGIMIPTLYIISSRDNVHLSSSAVRSVNKLKEKK